MCGIAGLVDLDASTGAAQASAASRVQAMCAAMRLRGPDGGGVTAQAGATLGMVRLAIVDVEHGKQPMLADDESVALVYNGEIYNAPELRRRLESRGARFRTRSDTEVILRRYEDDPDTVEGDLAGMWAFAIHDRRRRRLLLSRDRFGIKPLFLARGTGALAFASDLRCFAPLRDDARFRGVFELDIASAHAMLAWSYVPENATIYRGVTRLPPASRLEIDLTTGEESARPYWTLRSEPGAARVASLDEACALVDGLLRRAAREHLESDVPIAAFLSGGIDSSLVAAYAQEASSSPIHAYSIGFREPRFDESPWARRVAARLGIRHTVTMLDEAAMESALADALLAYDEPFGDSSSLATFVLSREVAREHKVALGGDGGDEGFAGYKKHQAVRVRRALSRVPGARALLHGALGSLPVRGDRTRGWTEMLRTARRLATSLAPGDAAAYVALTQVVSLAKSEALLRGPTAAARFEQAGDRRFRDGFGTPLQKTLQADLGSVLPNDMLTKVDRASMACSLEARVPLLDHRVVEAGVSLPEPFVLGRAGKIVLQTLFRRRFGDELTDRPKQGFGVPVEKWLRTWLARPCDELFAAERLERDGLLSVDALAGGRWRAWAEREPQMLWHAFALAAWCEATLGSGPESLRAILARRD